MKPSCTIGRKSLIQSRPSSFSDIQSDTLNYHKPAHKNQLQKGKNIKKIWKKSAFREGRLQQCHDVSILR